MLPGGQAEASEDWWVGERSSSALKPVASYLVPLFFLRLGVIFVLCHLHLFPLPACLPPSLHSSLPAHFCSLTRVLDGSLGQWEKVSKLGWCDIPSSRGQCDKGNFHKYQRHVPGSSAQYLEGDWLSTIAYVAQKQFSPPGPASLNYQNNHLFQN